MICRVLALNNKANDPRETRSWHWCLCSYLLHECCPAGHRSCCSPVTLLLLYSLCVLMCWGCHSWCLTYSCCRCSWFIIEDVGRKQPRSGGVWMFVFWQDRCVTWCKSDVWCAVYAARPVCWCKQCMSLGRWLLWGSQRTSREMWRSLRSGTVAERKCMWFR